MNVRTIQHPGVQTRQIDLTQYFAGPPTVNINNAYVMGYTDKGPIYDYTWLTSEAEFIAVYGEPTNEAQRYLFYAVESILANGGNPIISRMPYDNKQCKTYKGLTLTYGTIGSAIGSYDDVSTTSRALIDLDKVSNFIGTRIQEKGRVTQLFPRFSDIVVTNYRPKGYVLWQILSMVKATIRDIQILSNPSNWMKWKLSPTRYQLSEAFTTYGKELCEILQKENYNSADFAALYTQFKSYFSNYSMQELTSAGFNFSHVKYTHPEVDVLTNKTIYTNGITLYSSDDQLNTLINGVSASFNKIFNATTPGFVLDTYANTQASGTYESSTSGINLLMSDVNVTVRDLLINLNPTFEDSIVIDGEEFYRGEVENFMGYKIARVVDTASNQMVPFDEAVNYGLNDDSVSGAIEVLKVETEAFIECVKYTSQYTSFAKRFTINGVKPAVLGISNKAIIELYNSFLNRDENINTATGGYASKAKLDLTVGTLYDNSRQWQAFYTDEITHCADVARVYNDPVFYKMTDECIASVDSMLLKQPEVGYKYMVGLMSKDVELTNAQYDALVTTNNFEVEPENDIYGERINTANFCIVDKLKTVANGTQSNEGYFVTIIDPYDGLKLQRLLVNPFENLENGHQTSVIQYWGTESELAWKKEFGKAIDTCDTLLRVKNADGIYIGEPGAGNKTNVLDSWSYPMSAYYKNDSVSKDLMKNFAQIPLNSTAKDGESCIDKCYSSHIVVAVCRTGVNPADGKITVNIVESFFGSLFDEYDEATGATLYIGNLINESSNYIEFYKNEYIQPKFGGSNSKAPYNKTTVNQFFIKDSAALVQAAAQIGVNVDDYDINEDYNPATEEFHFENKATLLVYLNEHADDKEYPPKEGRYYWLAHTMASPTKTDNFTIEFYEYTYNSETHELTVSDTPKYADPTGDIICYADVIYREDGMGNLGLGDKTDINTRLYYYMSPSVQWKKSYNAFEEICRKGNINIFNKKKTCLYNLYQTALFTSFSQKECEKKIANTTGIYSPVYGQSTKVASNFLKDMDYCIKFIQNVDQIPIYFVADAGISTIAQFCDNIAWDSKNEKWITQFFEPDNDLDMEDHEINSFEDCATWRKVVEKLDYISRVVRKDCMTIIDAPRQITLDGQAPKIRPSAWENEFDDVIGKKLRFISGINSSYTAGYLTWFRTTDKFTGKAFWLPPTCKLIGNLVYLNAVNLPWLAPAGVMYGRVNGIHAISLNPCSAEEDQIYLKSWNYCKQYPADGFIIEGQKTTLTKNSAFNRINVRTLFLDLERFVVNVGRNYRYKVNNQFTREQFVQTLKPKFEDYTTRGGIYEYLIKCDDTLNTPEVIDNNELRCAIYIKPARLIEFILIDMVACKTGAVLNEVTY